MKISIYYTAISCGVSLLIGLAIGWALLDSGTKSTDITWKFGENELKIDLKQDLKDVTTLLEKIFSKKFSKDGTLPWLKENQDLYLTTDVDILKKISALEFDGFVAKGLREISFEREGPWAYQIDTIRIGIPPKEYQPKRGFANVCENAKYFGERIKVFRLDLSESIILNATGKYECPKQLKFPDIQLSHADAERLLGTKNFSKYENGMALVLTRK